jgi:hypothetical protein
MPLAARDEDRALILERAGAVRIVDSLRFVAPCMDQPSLCEAACHAVVELAHHRGLRDPNKKEFEDALHKVLKTSKDAATQERAKRYLQGARRATGNEPRITRIEASDIEFLSVISVVSCRRHER